MQPDKLILIADDEPLVLSLGRTILQRNGFRVLVAVDGTEAIRIYRSHFEEIQLLVLDFSMPGLTGIEVLNEARKLAIDVPAILTSGFQQDLEEIDYPRLCWIVNKPFRPSNLMECVNTALGIS